MLTVVEVMSFTRRANKLLDESGKSELIAYLAGNPLVGEIIQGTGGVRKLRFASSGRGRRGGARVIYYYLDDSMPLYALSIYAKNTKIDLSADDRKMITGLVEELKQAWKERK